MKNSSLFLLPGFLALMLATMPAFAAATATTPPAPATQLPDGQCDITTNGLVQPACAAAITSTVSYNGVRSDPGLAAVPIDMWNFCRYLDNASGNSIFVPLRSETEWQAFVAHAPIALSHCSRPSSALTVPPGFNCPSPQPAKQTVSEPDYYRWSAGSSATFKTSTTFKCSSDATGSWTQNAEAIFSGTDADKGDPSWTLTDVTYTGGADEKGVAYPTCHIKCNPFSGCNPPCTQ